MKRLVFIIILELILSVAFAQFDSSVFNTQRYKWTNHTVSNCKLSDSLLHYVIVPRSDTYLYEHDSLLDKLEPDTNLRTRKLIFFTNLNNDKLPDIVFDPYSWGCGLDSSYLFFNRKGTYQKLAIPNGYISNAKWKNNKLKGIYKIIPPCCLMYYDIIDYYKIKHNLRYKLKFSIIIYLTLNDTLEKIPGFKMHRFDKDSVILRGTPFERVITKEDSTNMFFIAGWDHSVIHLQNRRYYLFEKSGDFGLVAVRAKMNKNWLNAYISKRSYFIGWTRLK